MASKRKIKYGKLSAVIFLTALIWIWADLALDQSLNDKPAVVIVDKSANPKLWINLNDSQSVDIRVTLSGPQSKIIDFNRNLKDGKIKLEFDFDASAEKMDSPGEYTLSLLAFLQKNKATKQRLGLKVISCTPENLTVNTKTLVTKTLQVRCFDENGDVIKTESLEPAQIEMLVPESWQGNRLIARTILIPTEIEQARNSAIEKVPFVEMAPGQIKTATMNITVKLPATETGQEYNITSATTGFIFSPNLAGKYKVEILNPPSDMAAVSIRATAAAKEAYEQQPYQMIISILDNDKENTEIRRDVIYNLPEEFVQKQEIQLIKQPVKARFKLIPLTIEPSL